MLDRPLEPAQGAGSAPGPRASASLASSVAADGSGLGDPLVLVVARLGHRLDVEEDGRDVDARDAVDERVVGLGDEGEPLAGQPLDHPQLPQRLRAVELLGEDARGHVAQLLLGARRRQRGVAHVVFEVEGRIVDPERAARSGPADRRASGGSAARGEAASERGRAGPRSSAAAPRRCRSRRRACALAELSLVRNETSSARQAVHVRLCHAPNLPADASPRHRPRLVALVLAGCGGAESTRRGAGCERVRRPSARSPTSRAQVELGPAPERLGGGRTGPAKLIAARLRAPALEDIRIQRPWRNVARRRSPARGRARSWSAPTTTPRAASRTSSAPTTAPRGSPSCSSSRARCRARCPGRRCSWSFFDAEEARGNTTSTRDGDPRQPPVRHVRPHRRRAGRRAARRDQGDGPLRHDRRLRPAGPAARRTPSPDLYALFAVAAADGTRPVRRPHLPGRRRPHAVPRGRDPVARPDRLRLRPRPAPGAYWHTPQDTLDKVCAESLDAIGDAALVAIPKIGRRLAPGRLDAPGLAG